MLSDIHSLDRVSNFFNVNFTAVVHAKEGQHAVVFVELIILTVLRLSILKLLSEHFDLEQLRTHSLKLRNAHVEEKFFG